jgi:hypothetical protein
MRRGHNGYMCGSCVPDGCSMSGHFSFATLGYEADLLGLHGHRQPRDLQMPGIDHDASDVGVDARLLRNRVAPATGVAPMLYIHPRGWSLDGVLLYADLPLRCRFELDRLCTLVKNRDALENVKLHGSSGFGYKIEAYKHFSPYEVQCTIRVGEVMR